MAEKLSVEELISEIRIDMAGIKADVKWLKRLFTGLIIVTGALFGVDISGVVV